MIIRVIYRDGQVGTVLPENLEVLIAHQRLHSFKRNAGWVEVTKGPLRQYPAQIFALPERRAQVQTSGSPGSD